ncbi:MAG: histidinol dehydrogenase, partial [Gemmatimonadales bacterium]
MNGAPLIPVLKGATAADWVENRYSATPDAEFERQVREIVQQVRARGDAAALEYTEVLDGVRLAGLQVDMKRCGAALEALPAARRRALEQARINVERVHAAQRRSEPEVSVEPGVRTWREFRPIGRVGIYAPGGLATYPSSVLMAVVPARLAGCEQIAVCSPPTSSGEPAEAIMAAAALLGVDELYSVGGAQAIAAMAFGTETIARVDKIFGPGGRWVNAAKLSVFSEVEIDLAAGPSEVAVWTDDSSRLDWVAAELLAQAEHGKDSMSVAVLRSDEQAAQVSGLLSAQLAMLERQQIIRQSLS